MDGAGSHLDQVSWAGAEAGYRSACRISNSLDLELYMTDVPLYPAAYPSPVNQQKKLINNNLLPYNGYFG